MNAVVEAHVGTIRRAYLLGFAAVLVGCFTPFKALGYALPALFTLWMALHGGVVRNRVFAIAAAIAAGLAVYNLVAREFLIVNYLVAVMTYSTVIPILAIDSRWLASRALLGRMIAAMIPMILLQGAIGIVQAVYGAFQSGWFGADNGDRVAGTIFPHLYPENAFSNQMYAVNMALMLVVCLSLPSALEGRRRRALIIGAVALVLASVVHVLVFLVGAIVIAMLLVRGPRPGERSRTRSRLLLLLAIISGLSYVALPDNVANISRVAEKAFDLEAVDVPRAIMLGRVLFDLPDEDATQPYVGLGPGQFSSRAALIMSGVYLGGEDAPKALPFLAPRATRLTDEHCLTLMLAARDANADVGSSQQPFFSWLNVYTETGVLGLLVVFGWLGRVLLRVTARARSRPDVRVQSLLFAAGMMLVVLIGWQADYWEVPQAILVGSLALKVLYANTMYAQDDQVAVSERRRHHTGTRIHAHASTTPANPP